MSAAIMKIIMVICQKTKNRTFLVYNYFNHDCGPKFLRHLLFCSLFTYVSCLDTYEQINSFFFNVVHSCNEILFSHKKWDGRIHWKVYRNGNYCVKRNKPNSVKQIFHVQHSSRDRPVWDGEGLNKRNTQICGHNEKKGLIGLGFLMEILQHLESFVSFLYAVEHKAGLFCTAEQGGRVITYR